MVEYEKAVTMSDKQVNKFHSKYYALCGNMPWNGNLHQKDWCEFFAYLSGTFLIKKCLKDLFLRAQHFCYL